MIQDTLKAREEVSLIFVALKEEPSGYFPLSTLITAAYLFLCMTRLGLSNSNVLFPLKQDVWVTMAAIGILIR